MSDARVVIIGAGIVGAAAARALAKAGATVTVLDRSASAGGTSSGGEGNLLLSDKGPGPELQLAQRSATLWNTLQHELAEELPAGFPSIEYEPKGGLVVALTDAGAKTLSDFAAEQRSAGVEAQPLDLASALALEPHLTPDFAAATFYPGDAQVQPVVATEAFLASARRHGTRVHQGVEVVSGLVRGGRLVGVETTGGTFEADAVILAAGPWSGEVAARLQVALPVRPRRGTVLVTTRMPQNIHRKVYDADYVGAVGSGAAELQTSSVVESTPAGTILIGSSRERRGFDPRIEADVLAELAAKALLLFPFLKTASAMRAYGGFRPFVPDHLPVIGQDHRLTGLWHATGHEGAGIGLSLGTAELLCQLLSSSPTTVPAAAFAVDRPTLLPHLQEAA